MASSIATRGKGGASPYLPSAGSSRFRFYGCDLSAEGAPRGGADPKRQARERQAIAASHLLKERQQG
ncbi:hypothetical protein MACH17_36120 [Phaeobacter inhibens]|nr:hypothetical protein MACH17_36120 [Phaeobacter inhibens]